MSRTLIVLGLILEAIVLLWRWIGPLGLGRLPGDIVAEHQKHDVDHRGLLALEESSGLSSFLRNPPVLGLISRSRWIGFASCPVVSVMRLAAHPVGAHRGGRFFSR